MRFLHRAEQKLAALIMLPTVIHSASATGICDAAQLLLYSLAGEFHHSAVSHGSYRKHAGDVYTCVPKGQTGLEAVAAGAAQQS
jgi:hypothetical protein